MRVIFLTRDLKAIVKKLNPKKNHYVWRDGVYILSFDCVQNWVSQHGRVMGSEIIFFEDNPNALKPEKNAEDNSSKFLDNVVAKNFIDQTTDKFKFSFPSIPGVAWIKENPFRLFWVFVVGMILWTMFQNQLMELINNVR